MTQVLIRINNRLIKLGFTLLTPTWSKESEDGLVITLSTEYEVLFISGWQEKKDDLHYLLLKGFLQRKEKRPFFIQCQHQLVYHDSQWRYIDILRAL